MVILHATLECVAGGTTQLAERRLVIGRLPVQCSNRPFRSCVLGKNTSFWGHAVDSSWWNSTLKTCFQNRKKGVLCRHGRLTQVAWFVRKKKTCEYSLTLFRFIGTEATNQFETNNAKLNRKPVHVKQANCPCPWDAFIKWR